MKILWIIPGLESNPQNMIFARRAIPYLIKSGVQVDSFFLESRMSLSYLLKTWFNLRKQIMEQKYDLIHAQYGSMTAAFVWTLCHRYVVTYRGSDINGDPNFHWLRGRIAESLSHWASIWSKINICVSQKLSQKLFAKAIVLPSPMDLSQFQPMNKFECREKLGLPKNETVVGFVGGQRKLKRMELAQQASELAKTRFYSIEKVSPQEMPISLNACDVLIFTSLREGSPNIIKEALACGVPVVSVDVGDVKEWISLDPFSKMTADDAQSLAQGIKEIVANPPAVGRRADLTAVSMDMHIKKLSQIYQSCLNNENAYG
jgi:teichuronic acid biosynthesis glycosyltransferase TuaC